MALTEVGIAQTNSAVATITLSGVTLAIGDVILLGCGVGAGGGSGTCADSGGTNTYTLLNGFLAHGLRADLFVCKLAAALSGGTITYTPSSSSDCYLWVVKVASGNTATPTGHNADGNQAATANPDTGSITSGAGDTVVTYFVYNPTGGTFTAPTGYTQSGLTATIEIGPGDLKAAWAYQDSAAGGTINPTATTGSSVALSGGSIASMPVSGGGLAFGQDKVKTKLQAVSRSALWCQAFRRHGKSGIFLPDGIWTPQAA